MIPLLTYPAAKPALRANSSGVQERTRAAAFSDEVWELHHIITDPVSRVKEVKSAKRRLLRALGKSKPRFVKRIRIDLAESFERILEALLSLPTTDNAIYSERVARLHTVGNPFIKIRKLKKCCEESTRQPTGDRWQRKSD